ncbi:MAG: hypothetical protein ABI759_14095 [Candidatus Solibacter sp.]
MAGWLAWDGSAPGWKKLGTFALITISGRRLTGVAVDYTSQKDSWIGRLEVWAQR